MPAFKNIVDIVKAHPTTFWARPWHNEAADAARTIIGNRGTAGNIWAATRGAALAPFSLMGTVASAPVRGTSALWNLNVGGKRLGRAGLLAVGIPAAALAGYGIMKNAFGKDSDEKGLAPELAQAIQQQNILQQQQAATQQTLGDLQTSLAASAPRPAQEMPSDQTVAGNDNPTTRLSAGNMAELQGLAASQGAQMARA